MDVVKCRKYRTQIHSLHPCVRKGQCFLLLQKEVPLPGAPPAAEAPPRGGPGSPAAHLVRAPPGSPRAPRRTARTGPGAQPLARAVSGKSPFPVVTPEVRLRNSPNSGASLPGCLRQIFQCPGRFFTAYGFLLHQSLIHDGRPSAARDGNWNPGNWILNWTLNKTTLNNPKQQARFARINAASVSRNQPRLRNQSGFGNVVR